ncbi:hypothetical protein Pla123a_10060 [Posidoniimonas polymericola]|uniref:Zinc ribbon domain protein n=1 Tax=Posidoniimonas polymericola TaxID=2528002 RepID=A0A5C5YTY8_9BACT|nr:hypothetical protein [Posidoniimonas polymericola]TWT78216.1 hypothetical protein Pla123a_10060 [Posidoniimonas polymericola]
MARCFPLVLLALLAAPAVGQAPVAAQAYQRRGSQDAGRAYYHGSAPAPYRGGGSAVAAGSFQRPYPYHLDYYKQRYGGSYEPYFGNLYGPPNVVLGAPYGGYAPPAYAAPYPYQQPAPAAQTPPPSEQAAQAITCPHCHQPIYFAAPPVTDGP